MVHSRQRLATARQHVRGESGQALVEAALAIPVLLVLVIGVVAVGRITEAKVAVQAVAREWGRALAVAPSEEQGVEDAIATGGVVASGYGLDTNRLNLEVDAGGFARGGTVSVEASYSLSLSALPLLGFLDVDVSTSHAERIDLYRSREAAP